MYKVGFIYICNHVLNRLPGCLYAIGGCDDFKLLCSVEKLSGENGKLSWSYVRPLSVSIEHHAAVVCKNKVCSHLFQTLITCHVIGNEN